MVVQAQPKSKEYNQYFSSRPAISITMATGKRIRFVGGTYLTDNKAEIEFLDNEVLLGNSMIYIKEDQKMEETTAQQRAEEAEINKSGIKKECENKADWTNYQKQR